MQLENCDVLNEIILLASSLFNESIKADRVCRVRVISHSIDTFVCAHRRAEEFLKAQPFTLPSTREIYNHAAK